MSATGVDHQRTKGATWRRRLGANVAATGALLTRLRRTEYRPRWPRSSAMAAAAVIMGLAVAAAMLWLDGPAISGARRQPEWLRLTFEVLTDFGKSGWFLWPIGLLLVAAAALGARELPKMTRAVLTALTIRLTFLFLAVALPGLFVAVLKRLIGRARPLVSGDGDVFVFKPFLWQVEYAGMPSGHGTTAFAIAIAVGALWTWTRPLVWTYAVLIAVSRVAVSAHYPSDVIASIAFGIVGAFLVRDWFAARHLAFTVGPDGAVHTLPGPSFRRTKAVARRLVSA